MKIKENYIWEYKRYYFIDYKLKYFNSNRYIIENNRYKENELKFWSDYFNYIYDITFKRFYTSFNCNCILSSREYKSKYLMYMFLVSFTYTLDKNEIDNDEYNYYHSEYHDYNSRGLNW